MLSHSQIWLAIDRLADLTGHSASGLARKAGLDPTSFNKSKRHTDGGRERWPSTESIAKILRSTNTSVQDFMALMFEPVPEEQENFNYRDLETQKHVPLIGFAQAGTGGYFDDGGFPVGQGWEQINPPGEVSDNSYALKVSGDSMLPLYRAGDVIIVDPTASIHKGDRVVIKTQEGEVLAKTLVQRTADEVRLMSYNPEHPDLKYALKEIEWMARIIWASQ